MQYMAWAVLFLITVWQLFRIFGGPITEAENPMAVGSSQRIICIPYWLCKTYFYADVGYCQSALYSIDGFADDC